jgi:cyclophilin family peptidyl-prolyl cis-trans isomerase
MFKQNREFWLYFIGVILLFFFIFGVLQGGYLRNSYTFSSFPFNLFTDSSVEIEKPGIQLDQSVDYYAIIRTSKGNITVDLFEENAPNTVSNFIHLANKGYYHYLYFHRLIPGLLLQGGSGNSKNIDQSDDQFGGPGYTIPDEINWESLNYTTSFKNVLKKEGYESVDTIQSIKMGKYSLAMAGDSPDSSGSQFFIVLAENNDPRLNDLEGRHTVFGHVIGGFDIINEINIMPLETSKTLDPRPLNLSLFDIEVFYKD